jgi:hypothetical protein
MQLISRPVLLLLLALGAGAAAACDDTTTINNPSTPIPTTTETFAGTVTVNGAITHIFAVTQRGAVTATLTAVGSDNTATIGVSLGTWNGTTCQIILANDQAVVGAGVLGTVSGVGNLCLRVYDVGKLAASTTYSVDVVHP